MDAFSLTDLVGLPDGLVPGLVAGLAEAQVTVGCAESLTGGLLTALLTEVPGASAVVRGGLVAYATDLKHSLADVDQRLLAERGPVDPDVALALARGARIACGATVGLGLTGVAGPDPQHGVAVGTWFVAMSVGATVPDSTHGPTLRAGQELVAANIPADDADAPASRAGIRAAAVRAAIGLLADLIAP